MIMIKDLLKWVFLLLVAGLILYLVSPKYHFFNPAIRANLITGKVEGFIKGEWQDLTGKDKAPDLETLEKHYQDSRK